MNKELISFYCGIGADDQNRTIEYIINQSDLWWESTHDFIQWVFPTLTKSQFNASAPLLDEQTIAVLKTDDYVICDNMQRAVIRFMRFLRLDSSDPWWIYNSQHNYLRITRALEFINLCMSDIKLSDIFIRQLFRLSEIHEVLKNPLVNYWLPALEVGRDDTIIND